MLLLTPLMLSCAEAPRTYMEEGELADPAACASCHPEHYEQWSGSMHALAGDDPIFQAMDDRGQRETDGLLGLSCVGCHAPAAVAAGGAETARDLLALPAEQRGVTCSSCHLAEDTDHPVMLGGVEDPVSNPAHLSAWSDRHDRDAPRASEICGTCHAPAYQEWSLSLFSRDTYGAPLSCQSCHMAGRDGYAAVTYGSPPRRAHSHTFAGVDVALTEDAPEREAQAEEIQASLDGSIWIEACFVPTGDQVAMSVTLENIASGHDWPSCSRDRRAWLEVIAYDASGAIIGSSGAAADDQALSELDDADLWNISYRFYDGAGEEIHYPWELVYAESSVNDTLPAPRTLSEEEDTWLETHVTRGFSMPGDAARIALRLRMRPVVLDLVDDLIDGGELEPSLRDALPTYTIGATEVEWTPEMGMICLP